MTPSSFVPLFSLLVLSRLFNVSGEGDAKRKSSCIVCNYLDFFQLCFPKMLLPPASSNWNCDLNEIDAMDPTIDSTGLWKCLMTGVDSASCTEATKGECIWCAEPVLGLCVSPDVATKLNFLPYFTCDLNYTSADLV